MAKKKTSLPIRVGKPIACLACGKALHPKSEFYCSAGCFDAYRPPAGQEKPPFLSKWKLRKRKEAQDPLIRLRQKTRAKTKALLKQGRLKKGPCVVCQSRDVVPHHEDYADPLNVIWLCEPHHKDYHAGKIALFNGALRWNPERLIPKDYSGVFSRQKYGKSARLPPDG